MCQTQGCAQGGGEAEALCVLVNAISVSLANITRRNDALLPDGKPAPHTLTVFHALKVPPISVTDYVYRIGTYTYCSPECYIIAMVYLDRFLSSNPHVLLTSLNIHRLLITAVLLAIKFRDDAYYSNAYYASIGGISNQEMNKLELVFLEMIGFNLFVKQSEYDNYKDRLLSYVRAQSTIEGIKANAATTKNELLKAADTSKVAVVTKSASRTSNKGSRRILSHMEIDDTEEYSSIESPGLSRNSSVSSQDSVVSTMA